MTREDIATIELIVRQQWLDGNDPQQARFESWLGVDQDQALALLAMIPNRLPVRPRLFPAFETIAPRERGEVGRD